MKKAFVAAAILLALAGGAAWMLLQKPAAPQVSFTTIKGEKFALESLRGKVVLINFWATSCSGCIREMPDLVKTYNKYHARGLETIAVAMSYDPPLYVLNFTERNALPFMLALDPQGDIAKVFGEVRLTPTTFVIDRRGRILQQTVGVLDFDKLHVLLDKELGGAA